MKISVIGSGYVGTTTAIILSKLGHYVIAADINLEKVNLLRKGLLPFVEPSLDDLLLECLKEGHIEFTDDVPHAIRQTEIVFITVPTPTGESGKADLRYLHSVAEIISQCINHRKIIVTKSTVPVGTNRWLYNFIKEKTEQSNSFEVISNPEFLREGSAVYDSMHPDRTVLGGTSSAALNMMKEVFKPLNSVCIATDWETAELTKYAANSFLATKISFINEMARIADKTGANIQEVAKAIGLDPRIGLQNLDAGIGYGGSCFPKDVKALMATAKEYGAETHILQATERVNQTQYLLYMSKLIKALEDQKDKPWSIAVLGLTFKPNTDDQRESPAIRVVEQLIDYSEDIRIYDPTVRSKLQTPWYDVEKVSVKPTIESALESSDAAILCTHWPELRKFNWEKSLQLMHNPILVDTRNQLDPKQMQSFGIHYISLGRGIQG